MHEVVCDKLLAAFSKKQDGKLNLIEVMSCLDLGESGKPTEATFMGAALSQLIADGYIESIENTPRPKWEITNAGRAFHARTSYVKEHRYAQKERWPKVYWLWAAIITALVALLFNAGKDWLNSRNKTSVPQTILDRQTRQKSTRN